MKTKLLTLILATFLIGSVLALTTEQEVRVVVLPGNITIYSPVEGEIYPYRMIPMNLTMSSKVNYFKYYDEERIITLCRNCNEYGFSKLKRKPFDDGKRSILIMAIFDSGTVSQYVNFTVDTKKPKITKTTPAKGFADGWFSVDYKEENPVSLFLNYGNDAVGWRNAEVNLEDCYAPQKNKKRCDIEVNLKDYDLQEIKYWFNITDILNNTDESKQRKLDVDVSPPVLNSFNHTKSRRSIYFEFNVTEPNFYRINYIDYEFSPRWRTLCTRLRNGICETRKTFREGEHNVSIEILDKAGNKFEINNFIFEIE